LVFPKIFLPLVRELIYRTISRCVGSLILGGKTETRKTEREDLRSDLESKIKASHKKRKKTAKESLTRKMHWMGSSPPVIFVVRL